MIECCLAADWSSWGPPWMRVMAISRKAPYLLMSSTRRSLLSSVLPDTMRPALHFYWRGHGLNLFLSGMRCVESLSGGQVNASVPSMDFQCAFFLYFVCRMERVGNEIAQRGARKSCPPLARAAAAIDSQWHCGSTVVSSAHRSRARICI